MSGHSLSHGLCYSGEPCVFVQVHLTLASPEEGVEGCEGEIRVKPRAANAAVGHSYIACPYNRHVCWGNRVPMLRHGPRWGLPSPMLQTGGFLGGCCPRGSWVGVAGRRNEGLVQLLREVHPPRGILLGLAEQVLHSLHPLPRCQQALSQAGPGTADGQWKGGHAYSQAEVILASWARCFAQDSWEPSMSVLA